VTVVPAPPRLTSRLLVPIAFLAFVSIGLPDAVLGVAWPSIRQTFGLPVSQLGALLMSGMIGYLASCFWGGTLVHRLGVGRLLLASSVAVGITAAGYALAPAWWTMAALAMLGGVGAGAIDTGLNVYAARHFSPRVMNWMHACYGVGASLGPLMMTSILVAGLSWRWGYAAVASLLGVMGVLFALTLRLWEDNGNGDGGNAPRNQPPQPPPVPMSDVLLRPIVWMHTALFFVYAGVEATSGQWSFTLLTEGRGMSPRLAGVAVAIYWASLTAGRIFFGLLDGRVTADAVLRLATLVCPPAAALLWINVSPLVNIAALALIGFGCAPIFPLLISRTPPRLSEPHAAHAIGFQVAAAYLGIAGVPAFTGVLARWRGLEIIVPVIFACAVAVLALHEAVMWCCVGPAQKLAVPPGEGSAATTR
jgi:fucose permease